MAAGISSPHGEAMEGTESAEVVADPAIRSFPPPAGMKTSVFALSAAAPLQSPRQSADNRPCHSSSLENPAACASAIRLQACSTRSVWRDRHRRLHQRLQIQI